MKVLILSPRLPRADGKADSMTVYRLVRFLSQRHEVHLASFYTSQDSLEDRVALEEYCETVELVPLRKWKSIFNMAVRLPNRHLPLQVSHYLDGEMRKTVDRMIERIRPDVAYAHLIRMGEYLRHKRNVKRVLAMQISQTLNYSRMVKNISSPFYRTLYKMELDRVRRYEPEITRCFDSCLLISKHDKESLVGHEGIHNVFYSPHGVDVDFYSCEQDQKREKALLFCGVLETPTNTDAVLYFYNDIYPLIKKEIPDIRLYLAGKSPPRSIQRIAGADSSVHVTGYLKDIRPYYAKVKVGIDPLRIGAGLQNKLLIGMSMGQPMVCTSMANEGIGGQAGKHLLIADKPEEFAKAVIDLIRNEELAASIAHNARKFIEEEWTWEYHFEKLEAHFLALSTS